MWYRTIGLGHGQFAESGMKFVGHQSDRIITAGIDDSKLIAQGINAGASSLSTIAIAGAVAVVAYGLITRKST
jgi:hypothetical protein